MNDLNDGEQPQLSATASSSSSADSSSKQSRSPGSPLISTLNRLSHSTSRPDLPQHEGYAARTMRNVSRSLGIGRDDDSEDKQPLSPTTPTRRASASMDTGSILYPTLENHPEPLAYPLLVLNLAALTAVPGDVSNEELLDLMLRRLEPWVGEEEDGGYCLIVLAAEDEAGKGKARALPGVAWWLMHWRSIPRRYRKNLKRLYIVHPSVMTRTVLPIVMPLISPKSYAKLHTVPSLLALARLGVSLRGVDIPLSTLEEEARVLHENPKADAAPIATEPEGAAEAAWSWGYSALSSVWGTAASYLGAAHVAKPEEVGTWSHDIDEIAKDGVPRDLNDLSSTILAYCATTEGIFRRSAKATHLRALQKLLDLPESQRPRINWPEIAQDDPLLPPALFTRLLHGLPAPLLKPAVYPTIRNTQSLDDIPAMLGILSPPRATVLKHVVRTAHQLLEHPETRMDAKNLAIVLAPTLVNSPDPRDDLALFAKPKPGSEGAAGTQTLIGLLEMWITAGVDDANGEGDRRGVKHGLLVSPGVGAQAPPVASA